VKTVPSTSSTAGGHRRPVPTLSTDPAGWKRRRDRQDLAAVGLCLVPLVASLAAWQAQGRPYALPLALSLVGVALAGLAAHAAGRAVRRLDRLTARWDDEARAEGWEVTAISRWGRSYRHPEKWARVLRAREAAAREAAELLEERAA